jgi:hypothetical protein
MATTEFEVWADGRAGPGDVPVHERWALWGIPLTTFLPIQAQLLAGSAPRWYGWVLITLFLLALLRYAAARLRHAAAVIDAMPVDRAHTPG